MKSPEWLRSRESLAIFCLAAAVWSAVGLILGWMWRLRQGAALDELAGQETLRETAESLRRRNEQLTALYNIFSEITETLSLRYVVSTTLRETQKIMQADMAIVRRLEGDQLVAIGALAGQLELQGLDPVPLGEGLTGRAGKRGRTIRLDEGAETVMKDQGRLGHDSMVPPSETGRPAMESGIIAPLIVGAKIVGTLSCWSHRKGAFAAADEQILEMMASQVATAMVAADAVATSEQRARHDVLTGLPNRLQLNEDLLGVFAKPPQDGEHLAIAMVDIDHFKSYNDEFGHHAGDVTLQKVASIMRTSIREKDRLYRYGGEEFVFIFPGTAPEEGPLAVDRFRAGLAQMEPTGEQEERFGRLTVSVGLAYLPQHGVDIGSLIKLADAAMYQAKAAGRNQVAVWQEPEAVAAA